MSIGSILYFAGRTSVTFEIEDHRIISRKGMRVKIEKSRKIPGVTGRNGSGKDEVVDYLIDRCIMAMIVEFINTYKNYGIYVLSRIEI